MATIKWQEEEHELLPHTCWYVNTYNATQDLVNQLKEQGFEFYYPYTLEDVDKYKGKKLIIDMEVRNGMLIANQICYKNPIKKVLKSYLEESVVIFHFPIEEITADYQEDEVYSMIDDKRNDFTISLDLSKD